MYLLIKKLCKKTYQIMLHRSAVWDCL